MNLTSPKFYNHQLAVIGNPIQHSKSPLLHGYLIHRHQVNAEYTAIHIEDTVHLATFMADLRKPPWRGINITLPYKTAVLPYLDYCDDDVTIMGACNTIVVNNGQLWGYNTDASGFYSPIADQKYASVLIYGNGGAAKAVIYQCIKMAIPYVTIVARNHTQTQALLDRLRPYALHTAIELDTFDALTPKKIQAHDLIINATSVGMKPTDSVFPHSDAIVSGQTYYDLIYTPAETAMMAIARKNGAHVLNGLGMLASQGVLAFRLFFDGHSDDADVAGVMRVITEGDDNE